MREREREREKKKKLREIERERDTSAALVEGAEVASPVRHSKS